VDSALHLRVAQVASRVAAADERVEFEDRALELALDLAEPDGRLIPFLLWPVPELLERHRRFRTQAGGLACRWAL